MNTISNMVSQSIEMVLKKRLKLDELAQPGLEDVADYIREREKKYGMSGLRFPVVVHLHTHDDVVAPPPTKFAELM
jgi:hypothetical protein